MHKLLRAPRGCPKSGKAAVEPEQWGAGEEAVVVGWLAGFPPHGKTLLPFPPGHSEAGITRSLGQNNESPSFLRVCLGVGQERLFGSWGITGDDVAPFTPMQELPYQHWCLSSPSDPTGTQGYPCSAVQTRSGLPWVTQRTSQSCGVVLLSHLPLRPQKWGL